jgi:hypothetical protein
VPLARSLCKDTVYSKKEIEKQKERIEKTKTEEGKDEHDVRKQGEVLAEIEGGLLDELNRLDEACEKLETHLVRAPLLPASAFRLCAISSASVRRIPGTDSASRLCCCVLTHTQASLHTKIDADLMEKIQMTEDWGKAGAAVKAAVEVLVAHEKREPAGEAAQPMDDDEDDTEY